MWCDEEEEGGYAAADDAFWHLTQANPPISDFSWLRMGGGPVPDLSKQEEEEERRRVVAEGDTLHLQRVTESDAGTYVLRSVEFHERGGYHHNWGDIDRFCCQSGELFGFCKEKCSRDSASPSKVRCRCHLDHQRDLFGHDKHGHHDQHRDFDHQHNCMCDDGDGDDGDGDDDDDGSDQATKWVLHTEG